MTQQEERGLWARQADLEPLISAAQTYLDALPADMVGGVRLEQGENGIVVTLTAGADVHTALHDLRALAGPGQQVRAVCVRWSTSQLKAIGQNVLLHIGQVWSTHGVDITNGVFSLGVAEDVAAVERAVAEVADPCAVHVHPSRLVAF